MKVSTWEKSLKYFDGNLTFTRSTGNEFVKKNYISLFFLYICIYIKSNKKYNKK